MCVPVYQLEAEYLAAEKIFLARRRVVTAKQTKIRDELQRASTFGNASVSDERAAKIREELEWMKYDPLSEECRKMEREAFALY